MYLFPPHQTPQPHIIARNQLTTAFQQTNHGLLPSNFTLSTNPQLRSAQSPVILQHHSTSLTTDQNAEFQKELLTALNFQNQRVSKLVEENHELQNQFAVMNNTLEKISDLFVKTMNAIGQTDTRKNSLDKGGNSQGESESEQSVNKHEYVERGAELIEHLYPSSKFTSSLVLEGNFPKVLYRERNINIKVSLVDKHGNMIRNHEKLVLCVALYTCDSPPRKIETNTSGTKVIKGRNEWPLLEGKTELVIQVREVSSHFRNSSLFLIVYPKQMPPGYVSRNMDVDPQKISPLVIDNVVVKARKRSSEEVKSDILAAEAETKRFHMNE